MKELQCEKCVWWAWCGTRYMCCLGGCRDFSRFELNRAYNKKMEGEQWQRAHQQD